MKNASVSKSVIAKIIKAAVREFSENGFSGARMDQIAARARVNKAMLYYYIGDKNRLYETVLNTVFSRLSSDLSKIPQDLAPDKKFELFISCMVENIYRTPSLPAIMLHEIASGGKSMPESSADFLKNILKTDVGIIEEGIRNRIFLPVNPFIIHLLITGGILMFSASGDLKYQIGKSAFPDLKIPDNSKDLASVLKSFFLQALKKERDRKHGSDSNLTFNFGEDS